MELAVPLFLETATEIAICDARFATRTRAQQAKLLRPLDQARTRTQRASERPASIIAALSSRTPASALCSGANDHGAGFSGSCETLAGPRGGSNKFASLASERIWFSCRMALRISANSALSVARSAGCGADAKRARRVGEAGAGLPGMTDRLCGIFENLEQPFDPVKVPSREAAFEIAMVGEDQRC